MATAVTSEAADTSAPLVAVSWASRIRLIALLICASASIVSARYVVFVLVEPMRHDLGLNDKQISAIKDLAFVIAYVFTAVPLGRLADRRSRRGLISIAALLWGLASMVCGGARNFWMLMLGRAGIGVGEAGFSSPAQSLIADTFPPSQRGTAIAIFLLGATLGNWIGPAFGGWAVQAHGWRWAYAAIGVPGLVLAPLIWFTLPDVRRGLSDGLVAARHAPAPFLETARTLFATRSLVMLFLASSLFSLVTMGLVSWLPAFMSRTHHMSAAQAGLQMGGALFFGTLIGHTSGGPMTDWLGRRDQRWYMWVPMLTGALAAAIGLVMLSGPSQFVFPLLFLQFAVGGMSAAPMMAAVAALAPASARGTAVAILLVFINVIGFGLGPFLVATISDLLHPVYGEASLAIAMRWTLLVAVPGALFAWIGSRHFRADEQAARVRLAA